MHLSHRAGSDAVSRLNSQLQDVWLGVGTDMERATREASNLRTAKAKSVTINEHPAEPPAAQRHRRPSVDANADTGLARQLAFATTEAKRQAAQQQQGLLQQQQLQEEHALAIQASRPLTTTMVVATPLIQQEVELAAGYVKAMTPAQRKAALKRNQAEKAAEREAEQERIAENDRLARLRSVRINFYRRPREGGMAPEERRAAQERLYRMPEHRLQSGMMDSTTSGFLLERANRHQQRLRSQRTMAKKAGASSTRRERRTNTSVPGKGETLTVRDMRKSDWQPSFVYKPSNLSRSKGV